MAGHRSDVCAVYALIQVQSENGRLTKRLSVVEREAAERSVTDGDLSRLVDELSDEKRRLMADVERLDAQVNCLCAELNANTLLHAREHGDAMLQRVSEPLHTEVQIVCVISQYFKMYYYYFFYTPGSKDPRG